MRIKLFENYTDIGKIIDSVASSINNLFFQIFPDIKTKNIILQINNKNKNDIEIQVFIDNLAKRNGNISRFDIMFIIEITHAQGMVNKNDYINFEFNWGLGAFDDDNKIDRNYFDNFVDYLKYVTNYSIPIEDVDNLISKLNIQDYELFVNSTKYNL